MTAPTQDERRRHPRFRASSHAAIYGRSGRTRACLADASATGIGLAADQSTPLLGPGEVSVIVERPGAPTLEVRGTFAWALTEDDHSWLAGISVERCVRWATYVEGVANAALAEDLVDDAPSEVFLRALEKLSEETRAGAQRVWLRASSEGADVTRRAAAVRACPLSSPIRLVRLLKACAESDASASAAAPSWRAAWSQVFEGADLVSDLATDPRIPGLAAEPRLCRFVSRRVADSWFVASTSGVAARDLVDDLVADIPGARERAREHLRAGSHLSRTPLHLTWATPERDVDARLAQASQRGEILDGLGLSGMIRAGHVIELRYPSAMAPTPSRPTWLHVPLDDPYYQPAPPDRGWGRTCGAEFGDGRVCEGLRECVHGAVQVIDLLDQDSEASWDEIPPLRVGVLND